MEATVNGLTDLEDINLYKPLILKIDNPLDKSTYDTLIREGKVFIHDEIYGQLVELIKSKKPSLRIASEDYPHLVETHLGGKNIKEYGVWVYYPWNRRLVHLLDEDEFLEVRTNRNQYKITRAERDILSRKKIGIVGLSVGQSIALTLAMERGFGELRLADFDTLELSNLNRIRTAVYNLGVPKVVIAAREIAEIDPFLKVTCFFEGLMEHNIDTFFTGDGKLDLLVDECDGLDMKIICRYKARELRIPVLMDTSDRGMLDVERFDLDPKRPILHGTVEDVNADNIKGLSNEDKIPIMLQMLGVENISIRGKVSMVEVQQTINTWPQLASSVALGGAVGADVCRRVLLDQFHESGRYYIDLEELISDKKDVAAPVHKANPFSPLGVEEMKSLVKDIKSREGYITPDPATIKELVEAACAAPSTGNDQPWKWLYQEGTLHLFHDQFRSFSFGDFQKIASYITLGAAYENLSIHALKKGIEVTHEFQPNNSRQELVASIRFKPVSDQNLSQFLIPLDNAIYKRHTNRNLAPKSDISPASLDVLLKYAESISGAKLKYFTSEEDLKLLAEIIGACDRIRILNPDGHFDFVHREMRWTQEETERTKDGIYVKTLGLTNSQLAALDVIKNEKVISALNDLDGGYALDMLAKRTVSSASALCMIILPEYNLKNFFEGGRSMERFWLAATNLDIAVHPLISPLYLFPRALHGNGEGLGSKSIKELNRLRKKFVDLINVKDNFAEVFLAKIAISDEPELKSYRLPLNQVLIIDK
ncbi:Rv1355c family protein [Rubrolithibacter danxiaensis]|uniref:Rv1355c family protein n=1 Tax=Rubrolithibacter danxiaensis TaxID=3390805 RepID=UPI003BF91BE3